MACREIVNEYIKRLGTGIVNIVNIFRPQIVLLGGRVAGQGDALLEPLRKIMADNCFGGENGLVPELNVGELGNDAGVIGAASLI